MQQWHRGDPPKPFPSPIVLGDKDEIATAKCPPPALWWTARVGPGCTGHFDANGLIGTYAGTTACGGTFDGAPGGVEVTYTLRNPEPVTVNVDVVGDMPDQAWATVTADVDVDGTPLVGIASLPGVGQCLSASSQDSGSILLGPGRHTIRLGWGLLPFTYCPPLGVNFTLTFDPPIPADNREFLDGFDARCFVGAPGPGQAGFFPDIDNRLDQLLLAQVVDACYGDITEARTLLTDMLGIDWTYTVDPVTASIGSGTVIARSPLGTVICVSGTTTFMQLAAQVGYAGFGPLDQGPFSCNQVFYDWALRLHVKLLAAGVQPGERILLCGHSAGGAGCAVLAAMYLDANPGRSVALLTFGCPRPGDLRLRALLSKMQVRHIANVGDPVPGLPPTGLETVPFRLFMPLAFVHQYNLTANHVGQYQLNDQGELRETDDTTLGATQTAVLLALWIADDTIPPFDNHAMAEYVRRLGLALTP